MKFLIPIIRIVILVIFLLVLGLSIWVSSKNLEYVFFEGEVGILFSEGITMLGPELGGMGIAIITIDFLNELRQRNEIKRQLIRQINSKHNDVAETALIELRANKCGIKNEKSLVNIELSGSNLAKVDLSDLNLENAILNSVNFEGAILKNVNLKNSKIYNSNFSNTEITQSVLKNATVIDSIFTGSTIIESSLDGITDLNSFFNNVQLISSSLQHSEFDKSDFTDTNFNDCDISDADFSKAVLKGAKLNLVIRNKNTKFPWS